MIKIKMTARWWRSARLCVPMMAVSLTCGATPRLRPVSLAAADGHTEASVGAPQFPSLLAAYPVRPPWHVAGIDYPVGVQAGTPLRDPATISLAGVYVDKGRHVVTVSGTGVVLDSYDFSLDGGWGVYVQGDQDTIMRCNFKVGANNIIPISGSSAASNLTVRRTSIDGGGQGVVGNAGAIWAVISYNGTSLTVEHTWMHLVPVDAIDFNGGGTLIVRHNLFNGLGYVTGAHADSVQFTRGKVDAALIEFNTVYDPQPMGEFPVSGGEGLQVEAQLGGQIRNAKLQNNVIIASGPDHVAGYLIAIRQDAGSVLDGLNTQDNYMDTTGGWGPFYPPSGTDLTFVHNVDLTTGQTFPPPQGTKISNVEAVTADTRAVLSGKPLTLSLALNEVADVVGHPGLRLNNGGVATYAQGSGSPHLQFHYQPSPADRPVSSLSIEGVQMPQGAHVTDRAGDSMNLTGAEGPIR